MDQPQQPVSYKTQHALIAIALSICLITSSSLIKPAQALQLLGQTTIEDGAYGVLGVIIFLIWQSSTIFLISKRIESQHNWPKILVFISAAYVPFALAEIASSCLQQISYRTEKFTTPKYWIWAIFLLQIAPAIPLINLYKSNFLIPYPKAAGLFLLSLFLVLILAIPLVIFGI